MPTRRISGRKQSGQALIYSTFVLAGGLAALFFMFNAGQLTSEKARLTTTADAVAYSAGVMEARTLNYMAYINRALIANEVMIAQATSLASWARYVDQHGMATIPFNCYTYYAYPVVKTWTHYSPLCIAMYYSYSFGITGYQKDAMESAANVAVGMSEAVKTVLQAAAATTAIAMPVARKQVMDEVARANYLNDGEAKVDLIPLADNYLSFDGSSFIKRREGNERKRFAATALEAAHRDGFVKKRAWKDTAQILSACSAMGVPKLDYVNRTGDTQLIDYDDWKSGDSITDVTHYISVSKLGIPRCKAGKYEFASGSANATEFGYNGMPSFFDLSDKALGYKPSDSDPKKREPALRFAIRLTREKSQLRTSDARSQIQNSATLNSYATRPAADVLAAVSGAEVFFARPTPRADGKQELASLFNPYWQVHLVETKSEAQAALALQGVTP